MLLDENAWEMKEEVECNQMQIVNKNKKMNGVKREKKAEKDDNYQSTIGWVR